MKLIGLCTTFENANNYGTMLQAYATKRSIESLGYECRMIRYIRKYDLKFVLTQGIRIFEKDFFKHELKRRKKRQELKRNPSFSEIYIPRTKAVKAFQNKVFIDDVDSFYGYNELCRESLKYDAVVVGSDQLWLPAGMRTNFYNLMFVADEINKISYATSFGVSTIDKTYWKDMCKFIPRINHLSVREKSGQVLIRDIVGVESRVVADPTMLHTAEEWYEMIPDRQLEHEYIFCYFLGKNMECRNFANQVKSETGLKIVVLKHLDEYIEEDDDFGDIVPSDVGPMEFVNYIRHAKYVLTDSFHGTVFSILYHKNFLTFYRFKQGERLSKNSRIDNLLNLMGLEKQLYEFEPDTAFSRLSDDIDYNTVDNNRESLRLDSKAFLENALNG